MNRAKWLVYSGFILALLVQGFAFGLIGWFWGIIADILLVGVWLAGVRTAKDRLLHSAWLLTNGIAILGGMNGAGKGWLVLSILFSLAGWDLAFFLRRLDANISPQAARLIWLDHLKLLGVIFGVSLLITLPVLWIHLRLSYGWLLLLALAAAISLSRFILLWQRRMRK